MFKTVNIRNVKTQDKKDKMAFHTPWNIQMVAVLGANVPILRNGRSLDWIRAYGPVETGSF